MSTILLQRVQRVAWFVLAGAVLTYALYVVHEFYAYVDHAIYVATDDSLANISYTLATIKRYGFLTSPVLAGIPRNHSQFNFGPWYFGVGGLLIWLFGYSLTLVRSIHLWVMVTIAAVAPRWFRDGSYSPAWALASIGVLSWFATTQWPMARPDSMVSLFAVLMAVAAGAAIERRSPTLWAAAGAFAACGAFSHLIAWTLVPSIVAVFLVSEGIAARWRVGDVPRRPAAMRLGGLASGLAAGALMFYGSFGFNIRAQIPFLLGYHAATHEMLQTAGRRTDFLGLFVRHFQNAFGHLTPAWEALLVAAFVGAWAAVAFSYRWREPLRNAVLTWCLPPLVAWTFYSISLGTYPNFHSGYKVLTQVLALWTCSGLAALVLFEVRTRRPEVLPLLSLVLTLACGYWVATVARHAMTRVDDRQLRTREWVGITPYIDEILEPLPAGATAWGTVMYGIENPGRIQLVQFSDAMHLAQVMSREERDPLAPQYLVWGVPENTSAVQQALSGMPSTLSDFSRMFPFARYDLVAMVAAAPYGVTRIYERHDGAKAGGLPLVASFDPASQQWTRRLEPVAFAAAPSEPIALTFPAEGQLLHATTSSTRVAALAPGDYVVHARMAPASKSTGGVIVVSPQRDFNVETGDVTVTSDVAVYRAEDTDAFVFTRHAGGPLYVGAIDADPASTVTSIEAYRLRPLVPQAPPLTFASIAPWNSWEPLTTLGVRASAGPEGLTVSGNNSRYEYQVMSPDVRVPPGARVHLRTQFDVTAGRVCVGALNRTQQQWLAIPDQARSEYNFVADGSGGIRVVFANCGPADGPTTASRFVVSSATLAVVEPRVYADDVMAAYRHSQEISQSAR